MDNQSSIQVAKNPEHHGRMKHLDLRFFWLRDQVKAGLLEPHFVGTENMPADILTKALDVARVERCRRSMGLEYAVFESLEAAHQEGVLKPEFSRFFCVFL